MVLRARVLLLARCDQVGDAARLQTHIARRLVARLARRTRPFAAFERAVRRRYQRARTSSKKEHQAGPAEPACLVCGVREARIFIHTEAQFKLGQLVAHAVLDAHSDPCHVLMSAKLAPEPQPEPQVRRRPPTAVALRSIL
jgi:hypothetical protein